MTSHVAMASTSHSPFLATLNLSNLTKLTNDPITHDPNWPPMPMKLPLDIQNFEGKQVEDLGNHIMTFHLWCSSNSIIDDTIRLRLFQSTLMEWLRNGTWSNPLLHIEPLTPSLLYSSHTFSYLFTTIQEWSYWLILDNPPLPIFQNKSMSAYSIIVFKNKSKTTRLLSLVLHKLRCRLHSWTWFEIWMTGFV